MRRDHPLLGTFHWATQFAESANWLEICVPVVCSGTMLDSRAGGLRGRWRDEHRSEMDSDPFRTQRDVGPAVVSQLNAAGFADAEEIGRGGFGIVYRCTQAALDRVVAVKVLITELDEHRERFLREQRAMGRLTGHPNIVGVLQVGQTTGGYPYLVMQYHRQGSLEARISRLGLLPVEEVLRIGVKIAGALESAHRLDILHRDVKPANILLTDYGQPALSDFGIAHITGGFTTAAGTFTGSPAFTAPEILSGEPPSQASDTYSLGATLFAALTGHAAYERKSGEQMVAQFLRIATEPVPDLRDIGIPEAVSAVIEKAMARDPPPAHQPQRWARNCNAFRRGTACRRRPRAAPTPPVRPTATPRRHSHPARDTSAGADQLHRSARRTARGPTNAVGVAAGDVDGNRRCGQDAAGAAGGQ